MNTLDNDSSTINIEECNTFIKNIDDEISKLNKNKKEKIIECNKIKYKMAKELSGKKLMDLIKYIFEYKIEKYD